MRAFAIIAWLLTVTLACAAPADKSAPARPLPRKPSPVHTPLVTTPQPDEAPGYRAELIALADDYATAYYTADLRGAAELARRGLARAEQARQPADEAQFLKALGYVTWLLGDTASSLDYDQRLLKLADDLNDDRLRSTAHRTLGTVYRQIGEVERSRQHTNEALACAERAGDDGLRYGALNNLAVLALDAGDIATSRRLHEQVLAYREKTGEPWDYAGGLSNLAEVTTAERDYAGALALHERVLAIRREIGDRRGIVRSLRQTAASLRALGRTDEALARLNEALAAAEQITGHELLRDVWQEITRVREARGEFAAALAAERRAGAEREALAGERARTRIADLQTRFEDSRKQATILRLEQERLVQDAQLRARRAELDRARLRLLLLAGGLGGGALLLGGIVWAQRGRLRAERAARVTAEQANALKTRLVGMISHDLRSPLGSALVLTEEVRDEAPPPARDERLVLAAGEIERALAFADDLLDSAAIESGGFALHPAPTDLATIARRAAGRLAPAAAAKRQHLHLDLPADGAAPLHADEAKLDRALGNLVSNAIKYSPHGATVQIALHRPAGRYRVTVRDEGPGVAAADRARLFAPFATLQARPTGGESSHGLGLAIAHEIVRRHGGSLSVEPNENAGGSTFIAEFPAPV